MEWNGGKIVKGLRSGKERAGRWFLEEGLNGMEWRENSQRVGEWKGKGEKMVLGRGIKWNGMAGK